MKINKKLIKELVDNLEEFKLTELEYSEKDTKIKVSRQTKVSQNMSPEITIEKNNKNLKKFIPLDNQRVTNANENLKLKRKTNINMGANTLENCMGLKTI